MILNKRDALIHDMTELLNTYSMEQESDTPDFILAEYLVNCLDAFSVAAARSNQWWGGDCANE